MLHQLVFLLHTCVSIANSQEMYLIDQTREEADDQLRTNHTFVRTGAFIAFPILLATDSQ